MNVMNVTIVHQSPMLHTAHMFHAAHLTPLAF